MDQARYRELYQRSIAEPQAFWSEQALHYLSWQTPWQRVLTGRLQEYNVRWFDGASLNACYNCIDRHLPMHAHKVAIYWQGDEPGQSCQYTYVELHQAVCRFANLLRQRGATAGDRICIYMPMITEAVIAMLACARIGAVHSVVFGGFSPQSLQNRIMDAECSIVITAANARRGGRSIPLQENVESIINQCDCVQQLIVVGSADYYAELETMSDDCPITYRQATDPLFILYTSGSTGKPKGILHGTGGYLLYAAMTFNTVFDYQQADVFWCTADVGWITGHSYCVYGPLANAATIVLYEGIPTYPDASRCWQIIDQYQVSIFYTAPTAIRALMRLGDEWLANSSRASLRILGSVGEPINPEVWQWYHRVVGNQRCPIVDTWWQTETGGIMITPLPYATPSQPGKACWPFFGVVPEIIDGKLFITQPWPGQLQTVYGDKQRFIDTYFSEVPGYYFTGDGVSCDDGYYSISGRVDDVINVSGHRLDTAEIESAIVAHAEVSEAAVVGCPDDIKGEGVYAFVTLKQGVKGDDALKQQLNSLVRNTIGPIAKLDYIRWTDELPKTRSGKIMRRLLRKLVRGETELGDISTLANPEAIDKLKVLY